MRVAIVQETDWLLRGPHQQHHLFERLSLRGHEVTVLDYPILRKHWPREPLLLPRYETANAARIYEGAAIRLITPGSISFSPLARPTAMLTHYRTLEGLIRSWQPDLIVSYALSTGLPALSLARRYGIPYIFHVIDALHAIVPQSYLRPVAHAFERRLLRHADEVVLINEHLRTYVIGMGAVPDKATVLRTGVDLERFGPSEARETVRAELGLKPGDLVLFFMGWIYDFSGVLDVAQSLDNLSEHVKLLVVGDGDQYKALCRLRDEALPDRLILTGRVPYEQISHLIQAADVCLLPFEQVPATEHIVPIKLYEYMAAAKPVIASPLPGVQIDVGEQNGVTYAPASEQAALALHIAPDAEALGMLSRRFAETYCDWRSITDSFENLLIRHLTLER